MPAGTNAHSLNTDGQYVWHGGWNGRSRIIIIVIRSRYWVFSNWLFRSRFEKFQLLQLRD